MAVSVNKASAELSRLEAEIDTHWQVFKDVGEALVRLGNDKVQAHIKVGELLDRIKAERLYKPTYRTWDAYLETRWGIKRAHAHRLRMYVKVVADLQMSPAGDELPLPNERQSRGMQGLPAEHAQKVWKDANDKASAQGRAPTSADVDDAREKLRRQIGTGQAAKPKPPVTPKPIEEKDADEQMAEIQRSEEEVQSLDEQIRQDRRITELQGVLRKAVRIAEGACPFMDDILETLRSLLEQLEEMKGVAHGAAEV